MIQLSFRIESQQRARDNDGVVAVMVETTATAAEVTPHRPMHDLKNFSLKLYVWINNSRRKQNSMQYDFDNIVVIINIIIVVVIADVVVVAIRHLVNKESMFFYAVAPIRSACPFHPRPCTVQKSGFEMGTATRTRMGESETI